MYHCFKTLETGWRGRSLFFSCWDLKNLKCTSEDCPLVNWCWVFPRKDGHSFLYQVLKNIDFKMDLTQYQIFVGLFWEKLLLGSKKQQKFLNVIQILNGVQNTTTLETEIGSDQGKMLVQLIFSQLQGWAPSSPFIFVLQTRLLEMQSNFWNTLTK